VIPSSALADQFFRVDSIGTATSDLKLGTQRILASRASATTSIFGVYCGSTASITTGAFSASSSGTVGYRAAKAMCEAACGSSAAHMCSAHEVALSTQMGAMTSGGWIAGAFAAGPSMSDCDGWTNGTAGPGGVVIVVDSSGNPKPVQQACNVAASIACCE
jgi:hypothetical protein